jgi:hypothetical protein
MKVFSTILSLTSGLYGVGGQHHAPAIYHRLRLGTQCTGVWAMSGHVRKKLSLTRFEPQTVHPEASSYNDYAIPAPSYWSYRTEELAARYVATAL